MKPLVVFGVGGFGREIHELLEDINEASGGWETVGFLDGNPQIQGTVVHGLPVLGGVDWLREHRGTAVALAVGSPVAKARLVHELRSSGAAFPTIVHPTAIIGRRVELGEGTIICAGTIVTTDARIGSFATVNINATIGHDVKICDLATIAPGVHVSGDVRIGEGADLGTGSTIIQGIQIGEWSVIGAGASVIRDVPANVTAVGVPAKVIRERSAGWQR